jgi:Mg2+/citrate symporter
MIEFFTVLMIDYEMPAHNAAPLASIVYASENHCQQVMDQGLADPIYNHIVKLYGNDIYMTCVETDVVSFALRPRARP